jgi:hypothetical protein
MTEPDRTEAMREAARDALRELIPDLIQDLIRSEQNGGNGHGGSNGHRPEPEIVPLVPAPPVASVLRPSTWSGPAVPGEVIGGERSVDPLEVATARAEVQVAGGTLETVRIDSDEDLQTFVRALAGRLANPRDRLAIKSGRLRFALQRDAAAGPSAGAPGADVREVVRVERGAVTERHVRDAASHGARLVLAPRAVLTPLARDSARSLGVEIEKEGRC